MVQTTLSATRDRGTAFTERAARPATISCFGALLGLY
jgi:hypothetical protein